MLVRVLEIPKSSGNFHFSGGEPQIFVEVDWFRDESANFDDIPRFSTEEGRKHIEAFIKTKRYYHNQKAYLVLHPKHSFTINYEAP